MGTWCGPFPLFTVWGVSGRGMHISGVQGQFGMQTVQDMTARVALCDQS